MPTIKVPVLIVGAGPVGLSAGLFLERLGIGHRIIERRAGTQRAPAAHVVNARTFEIWRQMGADMEAIRAATKDPADAGYVYWVSKLGGDVIGRLPYERQGDDVLALTPTPLRNLSQHHLEPILLDSLRQAGASAPHYGHQWESAEQDGEGVTSVVRNLDTSETYEVHSRYLLAADGAGSRVRKSLGIQAIGPERLQSFVMIHFEANLRPLVQDCPGVLYWICDAEAGGTFVAHDIDREWVYMHAWDPDRESRDDYTEEKCAALVRKAMARPNVELKIRTISDWMMTAQVAEHYGRGRIFLIGDSAHRFPPTGGMGLNTGVQDAHNLAWKIAAVEAGWGAASLLDTYEIERRPVAQNNADQSLANALRMIEVPQALGITDRSEQSNARMQAVLADPQGRRRVAEAIENQAEHFDMLGLQLGFSYDAGALVEDGTPKRVAENPVRQVVPSSRPGARLPHGWVERDGRKMSTLDLVQPDRFTLLIGTGGAAWEGASRQLDVPIEVVRIGSDVVDLGDWWGSVAQMTPSGALLVRPDQHVAFRSIGAVADANSTLQQAIARVVCRER